MDKLWRKLNSRVNEELNTGTDIAVTVRGTLSMLMQNINPVDQRPVLSLSHGDPGAFSLVDALLSTKFNCYAPFVGILPARRHINRDLPYKLSPDDVYLTSGCAQAMEIIVTVLASPSHLEVRHYDLLPDKGWEVDLDAVKALADENTVAILVVNPGSPCGNVFSHDHLKKRQQKNLGFWWLLMKLYGHLTFGSNPFVPMGVFAPIVPVITLGSISKRWAIAEYLKACLNIISDPVTFIQHQSTQINFKKFFVIGLRRFLACITCPTKPEGAVFIMVKFDVSLLKGIDDDMNFCIKLAKEESVIILPDGLERIEFFCQRHAK
ncbi:hypothetical protein ACOSQ3_002334 [Xanthoceras sorbifolium]